MNSQRQWLNAADPITGAEQAISSLANLGSSSFHGKQKRKLQKEIDDTAKQKAFLENTTKITIEKDKNKTALALAKEKRRLYTYIGIGSAIAIVGTIGVIIYFKKRKRKT